MDNIDYGKKPYVVDIEELTLNNNNFRAVKWTGQNMQMTIMSIETGGEIGLEVHSTHDQFIRIEQGNAKVLMGNSKENLDFTREAGADFAIFVPAGYWHNIINIGTDSLKLYSIYAPAEHPAGTVHTTYKEALAAEAKHHSQ